MNFTIMHHNESYSHKPAGYEVGYIQNNMKPVIVNIQRLNNIVGSGQTWKPAHINGTKNKDFVSQQVFALDFDNKKTIITLAEAITKSASLGMRPNIAYYTFSHTEESPRFRLVFIIDEPVKEKNMADKIRMAMEVLFTGCDISCKDATRLFFGTDKTSIVLDENPNKIEEFLKIIDSVELPTIKIKMDSAIYREIGDTSDIVKVTNFNWDLCAENCLLLKNFLAGRWLEYNDLFVLATNMNSIEGGIQKMLAIMEKSDAEYKTNYSANDGNSYKMISEIVRRNFKPTHLKNCSYKSDHKYKSIVDVVRQSMVKQDQDVFIADHITIDQIERFQVGQPVLIKGGTGTGKSHWIKYVLVKHAQKENKKILLLESRKFAREGFNAEIEAEYLNYKIINEIYYESKVIDCMTYQYIEYKHSNGDVDLSQYDYIVCDEAHYFVTDVSYNRNTILSWTEIEKMIPKSVTIFMSATPEIFFDHMHEKYDTLDYNFGSNYSHVERFTMFSSRDYITETIDKAISNGRKALVFIDDKSKLFELAVQPKYKNISRVVVSEKWGYQKFTELSNVDELCWDHESEDFKNFLLTGNLPDDCQILFATRILDNGFNIRDPKISDVIIDCVEMYSIVQLAGRKRRNHLNKEETIRIHIKNISKHKLVKWIKDKEPKIAESDLLSEDFDLWKLKYGTNSSLYGSAWVVNSDPNDERIKFNELGRLQMHRFYEYLLSIYHAEKTFRQHLEESFGRPINFVADVEREDLLESAIGKSFDRSGIKSFVKSLNYFEKNKNQSNRIVCKWNEVNRLISSINYTIIESGGVHNRKYKIVRLSESN
jgi:hypothetical protein